MSAIRVALFFVTGGKYITAVTGLATTAIISRLITPYEFGIAVLGISTLAVVGALRELGSAAYIVQVPELTESKMRSVFTINLLITLTLSVLFFLAAPFAAALFGEPGLINFLRISIIGFVAGSLAFPLHGLLARELEFKKIAAINVTTALLNSAALIFFTATNYSFLSFAWANVVSGIAGALLFLWAKPALGMFRFTLANWREVLSFSLFSGGSAVLHRFAEYLSFVILGIFLAPGAVGLLRRASLLCQFPQRTILAGVGEVALPAFSELSRRRSDLAEKYLAAVERVTVVIWPALLLLLVLADPLVRALLGEGWIETVPLIQIMSAAMLLNFPPRLNYPIIVATGAVKTVFVLALIQVLLSLPVVYFTAQIGLLAVAWSTFFVVGLGVVTSTYAVRRLIPFRLSDLGRSMRKSVSVSLLTIAPVLLWTVPSGGAAGLGFGTLLVLILLACMGWVLGVLIFNHPVKAEFGRVYSAIRRRLLAR